MARRRSDSADLPYVQNLLRQTKLIVASRPSKRTATSLGLGIDATTLSLQILEMTAILARSGPAVLPADVPALGKAVLQLTANHAPENSPSDVSSPRWKRFSASLRPLACTMEYTRSFPVSAGRAGVEAIAAAGAGIIIEVVEISYSLTMARKNNIF